MLIILLGLLQIPMSFAQSDAKIAPIVLQKDQNGRPYYIDRDGDKIIIIDYKTRKDLQDLTKYQHSDKVQFDDAKSFYKESVADVKIVASPKASYQTYKVEEGDTWESISLKLYGVDNRWPQLKLWNENLLMNVTLPAGAEMKYIEDKK